MELQLPAVIKKRLGHFDHLEPNDSLPFEECKICPVGHRHGCSNQQENCPYNVADVFIELD